MNISDIHETKISNEQFKQFEYINIHNGFMVDDISFLRLAQSNDPNIQTLVFDVHCGPKHRNPNQLLYIDTIISKNNVQAKGSHRCLESIFLNLSTLSPPTRAGKCMDFNHHPPKLNELYINNIPSNYTGEKLRELFQNYINTHPKLFAIKIHYSVNVQKNKMVK